MEHSEIWSIVLCCFFQACTDASSMYGEILSPNYPQPYPNEALQTWEVSVPPGYGIRLYFTHLDIESSQNCEYDSVKVLTGNHVEGQLCGQQKSHRSGSRILKEFYVPYNTLTVTFQSDFSNEERYTGFAAYYVAVDMDECTEFVDEACSHYCNNYIGGYFCSCPPDYFLHEDQKKCGVNCSGNIFTELSGEITSPNYPNSYPENSQCDYRVVLEPGYRVVLTIRSQDFDTEPGDVEGNCPDVLKFSAGGQHFGPYCGREYTGPPEIKTKSNILDIVFQTDEATQGRGWKMRYFGDPMPCPQTVIPNAVLVPKRDHYVFKDLVRVTCIEGYEIVRSLRSFTSFHSSCQSNGQWSDSHLRCVPVDCGTPDPLPNGNIIYLSGSENTQYQATVRFTCQETYYTLQGKDTYHCSASGKWIDEDGKTELPVCIPVCGVPHTPLTKFGRIFGGKIADAGNFPWQIYFEQPRGGGVLISDRWILTAAHVVEGHPNPVIYAGMHVVGRRAMENAVPLEVDPPIIHPGWEMPKSTQEFRVNFDNDIALLRLKEPLRMGHTISPICLPGVTSEYTLQEGILGYISGFGRTERGSAAAQLRAAMIPVANMDKCRSVKPDPPADKYSFVFTENMICAGGGGRDSCGGDSGGAYAIMDPLDETHYYVAGLVSWGPKCGTYGIYTKVANYMDWITKTMSQQEDRPED